MSNKSSAGNKQNASIEQELSTMLKATEIAAMLQCSVRTVHRLSASGRLPNPTKVLSLTRWHRLSIEEWISKGCPAIKNPATEKES